MPFYLSEWTGVGTSQDAFVPVTGGQDGWSVIDLRPDPSRADGGGLNACLLRTPAAFSDARARFLADDKLERLTNPQRNFLVNRLGVDLASDTLLADIIGRIMMFPPLNRWKPVKPVRSRGRHEIWLGGELIWSQAATLEPQGELVDPTDDFNRANETPLASPWVKALGTNNANLSSNQVVSSGSDDKLYYYTGATATADHYSEITSATATSAFEGPAVRISASSDNAYVVILGGFHAFYKCVAGSFSSLAATGVGEVNNATCRLVVEGSSLSYYQAGVLSSGSPITDSSITVEGDGAGFWLYDGSLDNWEGADLVPPAEPQMLRPDADIVTTGWSTAPLFSKIDEESADGTVITATAS